MNTHETSRTSAGGRMLLPLITFLLWAASTTKTIPMAGAHVTVRVCNNLTDTSQTLRVHCASRDNDVRAKYVTASYDCDDYAFDFEPNIWGSTLFWCHLERGSGPSGYHADIVAWKDGYFNAPITWCAQDDVVTGWKRQTKWYTCQWVLNN